MAKDLRQIQVDWTGIPGSPYVTLFNLEYVAGAANAALAGVSAFLNTAKFGWTVGLTAVCRADQKILDARNGQIEDVEVSSAPTGYNGTDAGERLPPANQGLLRLKTNTFAHGRRIQGRLFLPGPTEASSTSVPASGYMTGMANAASALITASPSFGVWSVYSRPLYAPKAEGAPPGTPRTVLREGTWGEIISASMWNQWAIQRKRRD
jgi:hypothetical protein